MPGFHVAQTQKGLEIDVHVITRNPAIFTLHSIQGPGRSTCKAHEYDWRRLGAWSTGYWQKIWWVGIVGLDWKLSTMETLGHSSKSIEHLCHVNKS